MYSVPVSKWLCMCVWERKVSLSLCWPCNNIAEQRISISHETKDLIHVAWNAPAAVLNIHIVVKQWMVALLLPWDCNLKNCLLGKDELDVVLGWWCSLCEFPQLGVAALSIGVFPVMLCCVETLWLTFCIDLVGFRRASWTRIALSSAFCLGWGFPLSAGVRTGIHPAGLNVWCQFSNAPLSKEISHLTFKFMHIYLNTAASYCFLFFYFYPKSSISVLFPKGRNCTETAVSPGLWVGFSISIIIILLADKFCG